MAPSRGLRTVGAVTHHLLAAIHSNDTAHLAIDTDLHDMLDGSTPATELSSADVERCLVETAAITLAYLQVIGELHRGHDDTGILVIGIVGHAESLGIASPGAIGVSGVVVDVLLSGGDPVELAHVLDAAHRTFDAEDLVGGAAALLVATTSCAADIAVSATTQLVADGAAQLRAGRTARCRSHTAAITDFA